MLGHRGRQSNKPGQRRPIFFTLTGRTEYTTRSSPKRVIRPVLSQLQRTIPVFPVFDEPPFRPATSWSTRSICHRPDSRPQDSSAFLIGNPNPGRRVFPRANKPYHTLPVTAGIQETPTSSKNCTDVSHLRGFWMLDAGCWMLIVLLVLHPDADLARLAREIISPR